MDKPAAMRSKPNLAALSSSRVRKNLTPHFQSMLHSLGRLSATQRAGLLMRGHLGDLSKVFKNIHMDPSMVFKYGLLSMAKSLPILAVYFLTQWAAMIKEDFELALKLSAIAIKRTQGKKNCNESLALFARGHAQQDWDDAAVFYLQAMKMLAQIPHTGFCLAILIPTCRRSSGLIEYLGNEPDREQAHDLILEFERRLTTPPKRSALSEILTPPPDAICDALLGLCHWANHNAFYKTALQLYEKGAKLRGKEHDRECHHCRGFSRWVGHRVYALAMTDKRIEAEDVLRELKPKDATHPEDLEMVFSLKDAWRLKVVGELWAQTFSPTRPIDRAKFLCNLAAAHYNEGNQENASKAIAALVKTESIPELYPPPSPPPPSVPNSTTSPSIIPTSSSFLPATTNIVAIHDFFSRNEKTAAFIGGEDNSSGNTPVLSFELWLRDITYPPPSSSSTPTPATLTLVPPISGTGTGTGERPSSQNVNGLSFNQLSTLISMAHDLLQAGKAYPPGQIIRDYRLASRLPRLDRHVTLEYGCEYFTTCAKLWALLHSLDMDMSDMSDKAVRIVGELLRHRHGCCGVVVCEKPLSVLMAATVSVGNGNMNEKGAGGSANEEAGFHLVSGDEKVCSAAGYARHAAFLRSCAAKAEKNPPPKEEEPSTSPSTSGVEINLLVPAAQFYDGLACAARDDRAGAMKQWKELLSALVKAGKVSRYNCATFQLVLLAHRNMALLHRKLSSPDGSGPDIDIRDQGHEEDDWEEVSGKGLGGVNVSADGLAAVDTRGWHVRGCSKSDCGNRRKGVTESLELDARQEFDVISRGAKDMGVWETLCDIRLL